DRPGGRGPRRPWQRLALRAMGALTSGLGTGTPESDGGGKIENSLGEPGAAPGALARGIGRMALDREVAAIHHQFSASDVGGFVRREKEHRVGHLFPAALTSQGYLRNHLSASGWI